MPLSKLDQIRDPRNGDLYSNASQSHRALLESVESVLDGTAPVFQTIEQSIEDKTDVLFKWNGEDLSQFTNNGTPEIGTGSLTIETSFRGNPALVFSGTGVDNAQWCINPSQFPEGIPSRFVLRWELEETRTGATVATHASQCGPTAFCRYNGPGDVRGYSTGFYGNSNSFRQISARGSTIFLAAGTPAGGTSPGATHARGAIIEVAVSLISHATDPQIYLKMWSRAGASGLVSHQSSESGGTSGTALDIDGDNLDGVVPNTIGVAAVWGADGHIFVVSDFRILKDPRDL